MSATEAQAWSIIIGSVGLTITGIVNIVLAYLSKQKLTDIRDQQMGNSSKLDVIHLQTNGGLTLLQQRFDALLRENAALKVTVEHQKRSDQGRRTDVKRPA